ncbi:DNA replication licensing factor MCM7 [Meloidogyne graminicola]|uniref:DNA replication licensing factor MCM7 n=1 Tax=Meloidogyne graminicola TaxID=189291 RepID=A0A8S9ZK18_9BILA|nr:DNA replication licensing factor MCM7 [Meloidogyne graminicola]
MINNDYEKAKEQIEDFLRTFYNENDDGLKTFKYLDQIGQLAKRQQIALYIEQDDVYVHNPELFTSINGNTVRFRLLFSEVVQKLVEEALGDSQPAVIDALDAFLFQRLYMDKKIRIDKGDLSHDDDPRKNYPPELLRRFEVYFKVRDEIKPFAVRELRAQFVGKLVSLKGIVIRATEVKPFANVVTYICDTCGAEAFQPVNGLTYMPVFNCPSNECIQSKANGRLQMQIRGSKFVKFQEIRVQETTEQVSVGGIPRSLTVYLTGENTRKAIPGDTVQICGVLIPQLRTGFRQMVGGLVTEVFLEAHHIQNNRDENEEFLDDELTEEEIQLVSHDNFYDHLAYSIAPEIYGLTDVKKSLLLSLVGGVNKNASGMRIRGALNILLMGDPGVAKSQLLTYVDRLALRSQYTTGRGSSGVGLTAAVIKDSLTGEVSLEGGSLVLADRGICCIDEFDKMVEGDRTAIHEVMEQQTISIAKAGIMTSLNARVAIIAAANPAYGRYNPNRSIEENIRLPAALLSRFDILWLIQDTPDKDSDRKLAEHITYVHRKGEQPEAAFKPVDMKLFRKYIAVCKRKDPVLPDELKELLVEKYVELRRESKNSADSTFTSPRILLAAIRACTALARLRLSNTVEAADVKEALRLLDSARESLRAHKQTISDRSSDPINRAFDILREMLRESDGQGVELEKLYARCAQRGIAHGVVDECIYGRWTHALFVDNTNNTVQIV